MWTPRGLLKANGFVFRQPRWEPYSPRERPKQVAYPVCSSFPIYKIYKQYISPIFCCWRVNEITHSACDHFWKAKGSILRCNHVQVLKAIQHLLPFQNYGGCLESHCPHLHNEGGWLDHVKNSTEQNGSEDPGFESWLCHLLTMCPWASGFTSLSLSFTTCKMGT